MKFPPLLMAIAAVAMTFSATASAVVISQGAVVTTVAGTGGATNGTTETEVKITDGTTSKYYAANGVSPNTPLPTLRIVPTLTSTIVTSLTIYTGNDSITRDPTGFSLFGSNDGINYVAIALTQTISLPSTGLNTNGSGNEGRNNASSSITAAGLYSTTASFTNTVAYSSYQVRFDSVRTPNSGVQFAELQLNGTVVPEPATALLSLIGGLGLLARRRRC